jgi:transposase
MRETNQEERAHYSREFKRSVIEEYLGGGVTKSLLQKKHSIKVHGGILRWMRQLGYLENEQKSRYLPSLIPISLPSKKVNKPDPSSNEAQERRIKDLERSLEDEQLRSEAYRLMIDIAEKEFNIPIRKKPSTK